MLNRLLIFMIFQAFLLLFSSLLTGQSNFDAVYQIFQNKCVGCHGNSQPEANLDLMGSGANADLKKNQVYNNLIWKTPMNPHAQGNGAKLIYPGRADKSFLFKKINAGLEKTIELHPLEGAPMPAYGGGILSQYEKEIIRQWILYGAKLNSRDYDESVINAYYEDGGLESFPDGAPDAPEAGKGLQIKMGPFYLEPGGEVEFFQKYELELPYDAEITKIDMVFGNFSHHFLLYDFKSGGGIGINHGFRRQAFHQDVGLIAAAQGPTVLELPNKTAFFWNKDIVLDLNSHYINYSGNLIHQAEVYVNIYFEERGNALQEMYTAILPKTDIYIPNNGQLISFSQPVIFPALGEIFLWTMAGHTHKYGRSYKVHLRNSNGTKGELIYDGACAGGLPGCVSPYFDYQHIPFRVFEPLQPINMQNGFIHEASYRNEGPVPVGWGPTSDDEMMLVVISYIRDTTGIISSANEPIIEPKIPLLIFPNPASEYIHIDNSAGINRGVLRLYNVHGEMLVYKSLMNPGEIILLEVQNYLPGLYLIVLEDASTNEKHYAKLMIGN
jgi:hypothetical protein